MPHMLHATYAPAARTHRFLASTNNEYENANKDNKKCMQTNIAFIPYLIQALKVASFRI